MEANEVRDTRSVVSEEILTTFRSRQWEPEEPGARHWLLAIFVVAGCLEAAWWYFTTNAPAPEPVETAAVEPAPATEPATLPRVSSITPAPARVPGQVEVYECSVNGQRVLSDRPCGPDAVERLVDTRALNTFAEVAPPAPAPRPAPRQSAPSSGAGPATQGAPTQSAKEQLCEQLQARIDYINAKTREKLTHREGDYWRAEWHKAKNAYYDARCGQ